MTWLQIATVLVVGFVGSAEFGSAALVHPVIRRLDADAQLAMEQGLLTTFGRIMPIGMTLATVLAVTLAVADPSAWMIGAAGCLAAALVVTIVGNVPINLRTGRISARTAPDGFLTMRRRWDGFQLTRASLQLIGFVAVVVGIVAG